MADEHVRRMNIAALVLLVAALLGVVGFHVLPIDIGTSESGGEIRPWVIRGWMVWSSLWDTLHSPDWLLHMPPLMLVPWVAGYIWIFVATVSPFLLPPLRKSRALRWITLILSAFALLGTGGFDIYQRLMNPVAVGPLEPGLLCGFASQFLNFAGLLFIRRDRRDALAPPA